MVRLLCRFVGFAFCLFGFVGMLLALPVAAVLVVLFRHAYRSYESSQLYAVQPAAAGASVVTSEDAQQLPAIPMQMEQPASPNVTTAKLLGDS